MECVEKEGGGWRLGEGGGYSTVSVEERQE